MIKPVDALSLCVVWLPGEILSQHRAGSPVTGTVVYGQHVIHAPSGARLRVGDAVTPDH